MGDAGRRLAGYGLVALLAAFAYLYGLDSQHIPKNGDEYPYEHITRLTAESGRLLPLRSELPGLRNTKPPLLFWQGIASTGGGRRWTLSDLRTPSVVYTLLSALLVFLLGSRLGGRPETGFVAGLSYLAFFSSFRYGRPFLTNAPRGLLAVPALVRAPLLADGRACLPPRVPAPRGGRDRHRAALQVFRARRPRRARHRRAVPARPPRAARHLPRAGFREGADHRVGGAGAVRHVVPPRSRPGGGVAGVRAGGEPGQVRQAGRLSPEAPVGDFEPVEPRPRLSPERGPPSFPWPRSSSSPGGVART